MALDAAAQARDNLVKQQRLDEEGRDGRRWRVLAGKFAACFERARRRAGKHAAGSHRQGAVEFGGGGRCVSDGHDPRLAWKTGEMLTLRRRRCHVRFVQHRRRHDARRRRKSSPGSRDKKPSFGAKVTFLGRVNTPIL